MCYAQGVLSDQRQPVSPVTFQTIFFPMSDSAQTSVLFLYRIDRSFFTVQRIESAASGPFEVRGELLVELTDKKTSVVSRRHRTIREFVEVPDLSLDAGNDIQGYFTFTPAPGEYKAAVELKDLCSNRFFSASERFLWEPLPVDTLGISDAVFASENIDRSAKDSLTFILINRGTIVPFGASGGLVVQMKSKFARDSISLAWTLSPAPGADEYLTPCSGTAFTVLPSAYGLRQGHHAVSLCSLGSNSCMSGIFIPLPLDKLEPSSYFLKLMFRECGKELDHEMPFKIVWINKPFSLSARNLVLEALHPIASDDEIDQMSAVPGSSGWRKFLAFWKKQNPDSTHAFNPVMAEYYRRVDESIRRFSADNAADGYKNDRGRIFILFGSPTSTERKLNPKSDPIEIWTYAKLHKRFIFRDLQQSGIYTLTTVEEF